MNPKCHSRTGCDTFSARNADSTGLFLMPITRAVSLDHLVGAGKQLRRDGEAECSRGLKIECDVKMRRLPHWNVACFGTPGKFVHEVCGVAEYVHEVDAVAHERA